MVSNRDVINDVSIRNHISPHCSHLNILKFPDIVKLYACLLLYDHLCDAKSSNFICTSIIRAIQLYYSKIHRLTSEFHVNSSEKLRKQTDMGTSREISTNVSVPRVQQIRTWVKHAHSFCRGVTKNTPSRARADRMSICPLHLVRHFVFRSHRIVIRNKCRLPRECKK